MAKMITPITYPDWNWNSVVHRFCYVISTLTRCRKLSILSGRHWHRRRHHRRHYCCCFYRKGFDYVLFIVLCCYLFNCKLISADTSLKSSAQFVEQSVDSLDGKTALLAATDDDEYDDDDMDEYQLLISNKSAKGMYIGAPCDESCNSKLLHVYCDENTKLCGCERNYPVKLGLTKGCAMPKKLGEQCWWHQTCTYNDANSLCVQVKHNALCSCLPGYHSVTYTKPSKRIFCTQDLSALTSDLPTLLGVSTGIAVLAGLICMVLHLFSKTKYPRHRNYGDANMPPPIMYSTDTVHSARPSSRSSLRSSNSIGSYTNRRPSSAPQSGSKGILVSTSRSGAARSAAILLISCHISALNKTNGSDDNMTKHLQKQLKQQKQLLHLELPAVNSKGLMRKLRLNGNENHDDDYNSLDNGCWELGAPASDVPKVANNLKHIITTPEMAQTHIEQYGDLDRRSHPFNATNSVHIISQGSRRPSLASVHSTSSSIRSYSMIRIEKELQQKELRQEMKLRLARLQQQQHPQPMKPHIMISDPLLHGVMSKNALSSPSPITPNSTDELLPSVDETLELSPPESIIASNNASYIGPCSSNEALLN